MAKASKGAKEAVKNANRRLGRRLWDSHGVEWTRCVDPAGYYSDPARARGWVLDEGLAVALLLDHSALRWLSGEDAVLAVAEMVEGGGRLCENPLGASLWQQVAAIRHMVLLEEIH